MATSRAPETIVIASPLEPELVERIRAVDPARFRVVHDASLIPRARHTADHTGTQPDLDDDGLARWRSLLREADILFDFDWHAPADLPQAAPHLSWVQATRSGIGEFVRSNRLDGAPFTITNAAGIHAAPLSEFVVLGLLYLIKDVPRLADARTRRAWEPHPVRMLAGRRVLVIGLGGLGRRIAATLAGLGVEVWGARRTEAPAPEGVVRIVPASGLPDALESVDAVVVACPSTPETHHLIGARDLAAMRSDAILVNVARGEIVDEAALIDALASGRLAGAALDVVEHEPLDRDSPLWSLPNVLLSPHCMSVVDDENRLIVDLFVDNLRRRLEGRPLRNVFDRARGY